MMPLEHQVTSLEISQRLQELGTKQNSLFSWFPRGTIEVHPFIALSSSQNNSLCSAYTVAELGEIFKNAGCEEELPWICYNGFGYWEGKFEKFTPKEANARGKCLIYLLENKLITL